MNVWTVPENGRTLPRTRMVRDPTIVAGADVTDLCDRSNNIKKKEEGEVESKIDAQLFCFNATNPRYLYECVP